MSDSLDPKIVGSMLPVISRRDFIKGVIAGGAAVSSAGYLFRPSTLLGQSSFGMPGFMMASVGFLKSTPSPRRAQLANGGSGNLCRCQDYDKILTALMRGADNMRKVSHA